MCLLVRYLSHDHHAYFTYAYESEWCHIKTIGYFSSYHCYYFYCCNVIHLPHHSCHNLGTVSCVNIVLNSEWAKQDHHHHRFYPCYTCFHKCIFCSFLPFCDVYYNYDVYFDESENYAMVWHCLSKNGKSDVSIIYYLTECHVF